MSVFSGASTDSPRWEMSVSKAGFAGSLAAQHLVPAQRQPCAASARAATAANPEIFILQQILSSIGPARGRLKT